MKTRSDKSIIMDGDRNFRVFYVDAGKTIRYFTYGERNPAGERAVELGEGIQEFDADIDNKGDIHLVIISSNKNIFYCRFNGTEWSKHLLYSFSRTDSRVADPKLISIGDQLHFLYLISAPGGGGAIFHHHWSGTEWKGYKVVDLPDTSAGTEYDVSCSFADGGLNLAVYQGDQLSVWRFVPGKWKKISDNFCERVSGDAEVVFLGDCLVAKDEQGICFARDLQRHGEDMFFNIVNSNSITKGPVIVKRNKTLHIAWVVENRLYYRTSYDHGGSWGRVKVYPHIQGKDLELYKFSCSFKAHSGVKRVLGTKMPQLHIPFIHRPAEQIRLMEKGDTGISPEEVVTDVSGRRMGKARMQEPGQEFTLQDTRWVEDIRELTEKAKKDIEEIRNEISSLYEKTKPDRHAEKEDIVRTLEEGIGQEVKKLQAEIISLNERVGKLEDTLRDKENKWHKRPEVQGSAVAQYTINKYLKNRRYYPDGV